MVEEYRRHDALVSTSTYEGFGLVVLEALSQGLAVIATPVGCAADLVADGVTGIRVPPRDPQAIVGAVRTVMADSALRDRLGAAGAVGRPLDDLARDGRKDGDCVSPGAGGRPMSSLTIGITTRHRPRALARLIESLALLSDLQPEVIVFDDGSEPQAAETLAGMRTPCPSGSSATTRVPPTSSAATVSFATR